MGDFNARTAARQSTCVPPAPIRISPDGTILASGGSLEKALKKLYGNTYVVTAVTNVHTDGTCLNANTPLAQAGCGCHWNPNDPRNTSIRVPGEPTNNGAELYGVLWAITHSWPLITLHIYTDSTYVIHSVCHWAPSRAASGWKCKNADILKDIVEAIHNRHAAVRFFWVQGHAGNVNNEAADALARHGATLTPHSCKEL
ncbi:hypothetical protein HWV62_2496 [Athelia sp. TMB]|nr:hypothetical protein HWV62_2496 [Athelia sp. TMB]